MLKNGQAQAVTDMEPDKIDESIESTPAKGIVKLTTMHAQHVDWPIYLRINRSDIVGWYVRPKDQFIGSRGRIALS